MNRGNKIWVNGKILDESECRVSLFTHGLHYGTGGFEGIRAYEQTQGGTAIFRLKDHLQRFQDSAKILGVALPYSVAQLEQACIAVVKANQFKECYIRPLFFVDDGPLGVDMGEAPPIKVAIMSWLWGKYLGEEGVQKGARLKISSYVRPHVNSIMTKGKLTGQYLTGVMAKREAKNLGFDEALFLDTEGFLAEGSGENLFMVKKGKIKTTPLTAVLEGITRESIIALLEKQGHPVQETRFSRDEIYCADEVFLTGTAAEITPVREIDLRSIGSGKPGPIASQLRETFHKMVRGEGPAFTQAWLTKV